MYSNNFSAFSESVESIYSESDDSFHGDAITTAREAWKSEIVTRQKAISALDNTNGLIIFECDIPRLENRIDIMLLFRGIILCLEFKVEESKILEANTWKQLVFMKYD